eukprot:TRINITY_DN12352_c0_g1_i5.p1 TRINITY_DN12352_c0_g1~~TRINITY_DN12352_c0_g1_i5.p1  ORF type:complete len:387 (+),score=98.72 TRINITY_DN12352_c0_g1_i5:61-1161(+)
MCIRDRFKKTVIDFLLQGKTLLLPSPALLAAVNSTARVATLSSTESLRRFSISLFAAVDKLGETNTSLLRSAIWDRKPDRVPVSFGKYWQEAHRLRKIIAYVYGLAKKTLEEKKRVKSAVYDAISENKAPAFVICSEGRDIEGQKIESLFARVKADLGPLQELDPHMHSQVDKMLNVEDCTVESAAKKRKSKSFSGLFDEETLGKIDADKISKKRKEALMNAITCIYRKLLHEPWAEMAETIPDTVLDDDEVKKIISSIAPDLLQKHIEEAPAATDPERPFFVRLNLHCLKTLLNDDVEMLQCYEMFIEHLQTSEQIPQYFLSTVFTLLRAGFISVTKTAKSTFTKNVFAKTSFLSSRRKKAKQTE